MKFFAWYIKLYQVKDFSSWYILIYQVSNLSLFYFNREQLSGNATASSFGGTLGKNTSTSASRQARRTNSTAASIVPSSFHHIDTERFYHPKYNTETGAEDTDQLHFYLQSDLPLLMDSSVFIDGTFKELPCNVILGHCCLYVHSKIELKSHY